MTKIAQTHVWQEALDLTRPYTIAYKTVTAVEMNFLAIRLENGAWGVGCSSPSKQVTGETSAASLASLQATADSLLKGQSILHLPHLLREAQRAFPGQPGALNAVDNALHDAFCQHLDVRLVDWLGQVHQALPTSITIGITSVEDTLEQAREHMASGFRIIKLKIGQSLEKDVEVFRKLREEVGPDILIRVDANQGYNPAELVAFAKATEAEKVEFYEQPFPPALQEAKPALQMELPADLRRLCAADEDILDANDAMRLGHAPHPFGIFNIKFMKCGGIAEARRIAWVAEQQQLELMWGCNDESIVSITAALHTALASPATRYLDLDGSLDLARDAVSGGFILQDGLLYPGEKAGLGVQLLKQF